MKKIVCLGDSLTELGSHADGWVFLLQKDYLRRFDVLNRGLYGYSTKHVLKVFDHLLSTLPLTNTAFITILLGSNDCMFEGTEQHVPIEEYVRNMNFILGSLLKKTSAKILLITPPVNFREEGANEYTAQYVEVLRKIELPERIVLVDFYKAMENDISYLIEDREHLNASGNRLLYEMISDSLRHHFPEIAAQKINPEYPHWRDLQ